MSDKCLNCFMSVHLKTCSSKMKQNLEYGLDKLLCNTCKEVGSDSADEREAGESLLQYY